MEKLFIEGREITLSTIRARVSDYTVHNGLIWRVVGSEGAGINHSVQLERDLKDRRTTIWIKGNIPIYKISKPTGYIDLKR